MTPTLYLLLYLYGLVCIGLGFALGMLATSARWRPQPTTPHDRPQQPTP